MTIINDNGLHFTRTAVRWLCDCGEGTGVRKGDEYEEDEPARPGQWKPRTPFHVLSERVSFREHLRLAHGVGQ